MSRSVCTNRSSMFLMSFENRPMAVTFLFLMVCGGGRCMPARYFLPTPLSEHRSGAHSTVPSSNNKRDDWSVLDEDSREINQPNYSKYDDDRGDAETEDIADVMSCYTLTGLPCRHDGARLWAV